VVDIKSFKAFMKKLMHIYLHPVDGFDELKQKDDGSVLAASVIMVLYFIATAFSRQYTNFRFNYYNVDNTNILFIFISSVLVLFFFCVANWSFTAVFDGEGTFKQIYVVTMYSILPYTVAMTISTILSYAFTVDENAFLSIITTVGLLYSVLLIIISMQQIHRFSGQRNIFALFITLVGVFIILFLGFLILSLFQQISSFISTVFDELIVRFTM